MTIAQDRRREHLRIVSLERMVEKAVHKTIAGTVEQIIARIEENHVSVLAAAPPPSVPPPDPATVALFFANSSVPLQAALADVYVSGAVAAAGALGLSHVAVTKLLNEEALSMIQQAINRTALSPRLWEVVRDQLAEGFKEGEGIGELTARLTRNTPGLTSADAERIARTETVGLSNRGSMDRVRQAGDAAPLGKRWMAAHDDRTRPTHAAADGQVRPLDDPFDVGGYTADSPGDSSLPAGEVINCRCTVGWVNDLDVIQRGTIMAAATEEPDMADASAPDPPAPDPPNVDEPAAEEPTAWEGVIAVEGIESGDGRTFAPGSLTWDDLPLPLLWQPVTAEEHDGSVLVGGIDTITRDGDKITATGTIDVTGSDGAEAWRLMQAGLLTGVSVDVDNIADADVEVAADEDGMPTAVTFHAGRIRAATLTPLPAFPEAIVAPTTDAAPTPEAAPDVTPDPETVTAAGGPVAPPDDWFADPHLTEPTPLTIDDNGRVYGHLAQWGTCHVGIAGECVTAPREPDHNMFTTGELVTASGQRVRVGQLTFATGHAASNAGPDQAVAHYDMTGTAFCDVACGEDNHGIWVAGGTRPDISDKQLREIRAAAPSGDWRRINGRLRLVAGLMVNVPGYPVARVASGAQLSLIAAGIVTAEPRTVTASTLQRIETYANQSRQARAERLAGKVHG